MKAKHEHLGSSLLMCRYVDRKWVLKVLVLTITSVATTSLLSYVSISSQYFRKHVFLFSLSLRSHGKSGLACSIWYSFFTTFEDVPSRRYYSCSSSNRSTASTVSVPDSRFVNSIICSLPNVLNVSEAPCSSNHLAPSMLTEQQA